MGSNPLWSTPYVHCSCLELYGQWHDYSPKFVKKSAYGGSVGLGEMKRQFHFVVFTLISVAQGIEPSFAQSAVQLLGTSEDKPLLMESTIILPDSETQQEPCGVPKKPLLIAQASNVLDFHSLRGTTILPTDTTGIRIVPTNTPSICKAAALKEEDSTEACAGFLIAGGSCQPFSFEDDSQSIVVGQGGTVFAPQKDRSLLLQEGKVVALAGERGLTVRTVYGNLYVESHATVLVEQGSGVLRAAILGGDFSKMDIVRDSDIHSIRIGYGEELIVAEEGISDEELIRVDGVDREPISAEIAVTGLKLQKLKFDTVMMADREQLLLCNTGCFNIAMRNRFHEMKDKLKMEKPLTSGFCDDKACLPALNKNELAEAAYVQPVPVTFSTVTDSNDNCTIKHDGRAKISHDKKGRINLNQGEVLINTFQAVTFILGDYAIAIDRGGLVLISREDLLVHICHLGETTGIRNFLDVVTLRPIVTAPAYAHILLPNWSCKIRAGQEVFLTKDAVSAIKQMKADAICRRNLRQEQTKNGYYITRSEFSATSVLQNNQLLCNVKKSTRSGDRSLFNRMIKLAAALQQVFASNGAFAPISNND